MKPLTHPALFSVSVFAVEARRKKPSFASSSEAEMKKRHRTMRLGAKDRKIKCFKSLSLVSEVQSVNEMS
jgi:hypothetical protein